MKRKIFGLSEKLIAGVLLLSVLLCCAISYMGYREFTTVLEEEYNRSAYEIAETAKTYLNPDRLEEYLKTGQVVFFDKEDMDDMLVPVRASSSLPFVSPIVSYKGYELLDGGCAMPIPLEQSMVDGNRRNVVVLTRDPAYRKTPKSDFPRAVLRVKYGDYPNFVQTMLDRSQIYNSEVELCRVEERLGNAVVVRPRTPLLVSRYEKDPERLKAIYELGREDCRRKLPEIRAILARDAQEGGA